jgi:hypothetical protein
MKFLKQDGIITVTLLYKLFVSMVDVKMMIGSLTKERKKERKKERTACNYANIKKTPSLPSLGKIIIF